MLAAAWKSWELQGKLGAKDFFCPDIYLLPTAASTSQDNTYHQCEHSSRSTYRDCPVVPSPVACSKNAVRGLHTECGSRTGAIALNRQPDSHYLVM